MDFPKSFHVTVLSLNPADTTLPRQVTLRKWAYQAGEGFKFEQDPCTSLHDDEQNLFFLEDISTGRVFALQRAYDSFQGIFNDATGLGHLNK